MAFFDDLSKKIGEVADTVSDKTKDFAETTKLNQAIACEEKKITKYFIEVGKYYFEKEKNNPDSSIAELCSKIAASQQTVQNLEQKINDIKKNQV